MKYLGLFLAASFGLLAAFEARTLWKYKPTHTQWRYTSRALSWVALAGFTLLTCAFGFSSWSAW